MPGWEKVNITQPPALGAAPGLTSGKKAHFNALQAAGKNKEKASLRGLHTKRYQKGQIKDSKCGKSNVSVQ